MNCWLATIFIFTGACSIVHAGTFDCVDLHLAPIVADTFVTTPQSDFPYRDALPSTDAPSFNWFKKYGSYGPCPLPYPGVKFREGIDQIKWSQKRFLSAAKRLIGTPYAHFHIPEMGGLDCSNFTSFAYNYAFGIRFSSNIGRQSREAGRLLRPDEKKRLGDLIFFYDSKRDRISHVAIYISEDLIIDSTGPGVQIRENRGWYKDSYAWARRLIE